MIYVAEPTLTATAVTTAVATSAIKAITSSAVQASSPTWKKLVQSSVFESRKIRRLEQWKSLRDYRRKSGKLDAFLKSRLCIGLIETYVIALGSTGTEPTESADLEQLFRSELKRELNLTDNAGEQLSVDLWILITASVKIAIDDLKNRGSLHVNDLLLFAQLTEKRDGESLITAAVRERKQISGDRHRAEAALALVAEIQRIGAKAFSEMLMPHAREHHRVEVDQLYVQRNLLQLPVDWKANRVQHELDDKDAVLIHENEVAERRFIVIGSPGAGKSTYIRRLLLNVSSDHDERVAPLVLEVKTWSENSGSFVEMLAARLQSSMQIDATVAALGDVLSLGLGLVVFDGLDEIVDINQRRSLVGAIEAFVGRYPLARVVATSRREGYDSAPLNPLKFPAYRVPDFDQEQMEQYVKRWFSLLARFDDIDAQGLAKSFIDESIHAVDLRQNPLMLSLLCLLYQYDGYIPANRARVYEECAELLFGRWDRVRKVNALVKTDSRGHHLIEQIAMHFYGRQGSQAVETEHVLKLVVREYLHANVVDDEFRASQEAEHFLEHCSTRAWLLTKVGTSPKSERLFGFTHRTFMEYFAACYIARHAVSPEELVAQLQPIIDSGTSDIISQLAVDRFGERAFNGVDDALRLLLFGSRTLTHRYNSRYLPFVLRSLEFLYPKPLTVKAILTAVLRDYSKNSRDWSSSPAARVPRNVLPQFKALCKSLSATLDNGSVDEIVAAEGAKLLRAQEAIAREDLKWVQLNAPKMLVSMVMSYDISLSSYLRAVGSGALADVTDRCTTGIRARGPLALAMEEVVTSGYVSEILEKMFKTLIANPKVLFPMTKAAIADLSMQIESVSEWGVRQLLNAQVPVRRQIFSGFTHVCAAVALEALHHGMYEHADTTMKYGFGEEWRIDAYTRPQYIFSIIKESPFIELNDDWRRHIESRYKLICK
jgi:NACHT domain-containing protein